MVFKDYYSFSITIHHSQPLLTIFNDRWSWSVITNNIEIDIDYKIDIDIGYCTHIGYNIDLNIGNNIDIEDYNIWE